MIVKVVDQLQNLLIKTAEIIFGLQITVQNIVNFNAAELTKFYLLETVLEHQ